MCPMSRVCWGTGVVRQGRPVLGVFNQSREQLNTMGQRSRQAKTQGITKGNGVVVVMQMPWAWGRLLGKEQV